MVVWYLVRWITNPCPELAEAEGLKRWVSIEGKYEVITGWFVKAHRKHMKVLAESTPPPQSILPLSRFDNPMPREKLLEQMKITIKDWANRPRKRKIFKDRAKALLKLKRKLKSMGE